MDSAYRLRLVVKNIWSKKLRTVLTVTALTIGVSAIIYLVSFAFGIERLATNEISGNDAFMLIDVGTGSSQIVTLNADSLNKIKDIGNVTGAETITNAAARVSSGDAKQVESSLFGVSDNYLNWTGEKIIAGTDSLQAADGQDNPSVIINTALVKLLPGEIPTSVIGKVLTTDVIISREVAQNESGATVNSKPFRVVGVAKDDSAPRVFVRADILGSYGAKVYSQAKIKTSDRNAVANVRTQIDNYGFKTEYLGETLAQVEQIFMLFKVILGSFGLIALIVACLGMFNTLTIALLERTKEIALLKILGLRRWEIFKMYILESTIIGLIGSIIGIGVGMLLGAISNRIFYNFATKAGGEGARIFSFEPQFLLLMVAFVLVTAFLTGLYPARRAMRINALDALRYE